MNAGESPGKSPGESPGDTPEACGDAPLVVLLIDDDLDVLAANARFLRVHGLEVLVADRAQAGLAWLEARAVDAVVTDLRMPDGDGIAFARRARERHPFLPIVFFSGYARVPDVVAAMRLGAADFLEKPVEPSILLERLLSLRAAPAGAVPSPRVAFDPHEADLPFRTRVLAYERHLIETSLASHDGRIADVLQALRINRRTLNEKMQRLGIVRDG